MRNIFLVMAFSGTIILIIYYIVNFFLGRFLNIKTKRYILLLATLFSLFPLPYFKYIYLSLIVAIFPFMNQNKDYNIVSLSKSVVVFFENHNKIYSINQKVILIIYTVSVILSLLIILFEIRKYCKLMYIIKKHSISIDRKEIEVFHEIENQLKIKSHIVGVKSCFVSVPMTAGVIFPTIILPRNRDICCDYQHVIYHEMVHIKHKDVWVRFLGLLVIAIHWYNPFSYLLFYTLSHINELYSDEVVTLRFNKKQKYDYCYMMLDFLEKNNSGEKSHRALSYFIGNNKNQIKERIDSIMNERKEHKVIGGLICFICFICGGISTFLYEPPQIVYAQEYEASYEAGEIEFEGKEEENILLSHDYFIDLEGNIFPLIHGESKAPCFHRYVDGIQKNHTRNKNGSCTIKHYNAKRCTICNALKTGSLYKTETYVKCPH